MTGRHAINDQAVSALRRYLAANVDALMADGQADAAAQVRQHLHTVDHLARTSIGLAAMLRTPEAAQAVARAMLGNDEYTDDDYRRALQNARVTITTIVEALRQS